MAGYNAFISKFVAFVNGNVSIKFSRTYRRRINDQGGKALNMSDTSSHSLSTRLRDVSIKINRICNKSLSLFLAATNPRSNRTDEFRRQTGSLEATMPFSTFGKQPFAQAGITNQHSRISPRKGGKRRSQAAPEEQTMKERKRSTIIHAAKSLPSDVLSE